MNATGCTCPMPRLSVGTIRHEEGCPALRTIGPLPIEHFSNRLAALQARLDAAEREWRSEKEWRKELWHKLEAAQAVVEAARYVAHCHKMGDFIPQSALEELSAAVDGLARSGDA